MDTPRHHRRSIRLQGYDYTQARAYFVTMCARHRECLFGEVMDGKMLLNTAGNIVDECWRAIPVHFKHTALDTFVVMPNHIHGIIVIANVVVGARHAVPLQPSDNTERFGQPIPGSLPTIVRSFKSAATRRINEMRDSPGATLWQRNYYEHVIRNQGALDAIRGYIRDNPGMWMHDLENLKVRPPGPPEKKAIVTDAV